MGDSKAQDESVKSADTGGSGGSRKKKKKPAESLKPWREEEPEKNHPPPNSQKNSGIICRGELGNARSTLGAHVGIVKEERPQEEIETAKEVVTPGIDPGDVSPNKQAEAFPSTNDESSTLALEQESENQRLHDE